MRKAVHGHIYFSGIRCKEAAKMIAQHQRHLVEMRLYPLDSCVPLDFFAGDLARSRAGTVRERCKHLRDGCPRTNPAPAAFSSHNLIIVSTKENRTITTRDQYKAV